MCSNPVRNFFLAMILCSMTLLGCRKEDDKELYFYGDSLVAKWDIAEYFPVWRTYNYGVSGASVSYLNAYAGRCVRQQIVLLIGTNDHILMCTDMEGYVNHYLNIIQSLNAEKIYLFSVLPRDVDTDEEGCNDYIDEFNERIEESVALWPNVRYLDVHDLFLGLNGKMSRQYTYDGIHINNAGYEILSKVLYEALP